MISVGINNTGSQTVGQDLIRTAWNNTFALLLSNLFQLTHCPPGDLAIISIIT